MIDPKLRSYVRGLGLLISLLALAFVVYQFSQQSGFDSLRSLQVKDWILVLLLSGAYAVASVLLALSWRLILLHTGSQASWSWAIVTYGVSQLAKYLPGNVLHFAGRQALAMSSGLPGKGVLWSTAYELMSLSLAGLSISLIFLTRLGWTEVQAISTAVGFVVVVSLCLERLKFRHLMAAYLLHVVFLLVSGSIFAIVVHTLGLEGERIGQLMYWLCAAHVAAWLVGLLVPGAPAGLGVREATLLVLLDGLLPAGLLLVAVAVARLVNLMGDLLFFAVSALIYPRIKNTNNAVKSSGETH